MRYLKINTLEKGWYDKDEALLQAAFQLLIKKHSNVVMA